MFDYRAEQQAQRARASTGVFRSTNGNGQIVERPAVHQLLASSPGRFHGGQPNNALSRAAWSHNGHAPGSRPR